MCVWSVGGHARWAQVKEPPPSVVRCRQLGVVTKEVLKDGAEVAASMDSAYDDAYDHDEL